MHKPSLIAETEKYFVINKPPFMAVEPPSNSPTLLDWMIENGHIDPTAWQPSERCGVVHRIDSDTSGIVIWAKNANAQQKLKLLWQGRAVKKTYTALVVGECPPSGTIELAIMRDNKKDKQKVSLLNDAGSRPAITEYTRIKLCDINGEKVSLVSAHPITGRTHQLRVHFKAIGHPLVADKLYGEKKSDVVAEETNLNRQFLHASEITIEDDTYKCPLSEDLELALGKLACF